MTGFIFATGIENSAPLITGPDGKDLRRDEMTLCGHDLRFAEDFALAKEIGVSHLRYGVPWYRIHTAPGRYDWDFSDAAFDALRKTGLIPIVDLCHFGTPDWVGGFQDPSFPHHLAEYADAVARRYPWLRLFTPVNEMYIAARFSAQHGWWNERLSDERSYVTALKNLAAADIRAARAISAVRGDALFVQSESSEFYSPNSPGALALTVRKNEERFIALDLALGYDVSATTYRYLIEHGMTPAEYDWFRENALDDRVVIGADYYSSNEHVVFDDGRIEELQGAVGYSVVTQQYSARYRRPIMHTEANLQDPEQAPAWMRSLMRQTVELIASGTPVLGFTWYSLTDQVDWDEALRFPRNRVNPLGLFDLDRKIRPIGEAYRDEIAQWRPMQQKLAMSQLSLW